MAFLQRGRADRREQRLFNEDDLIWGVPRKPGYDDRDDPKAHAGVTQHAFEPGSDERAICGFEPPKRASGPGGKPRPQLSLPAARLNPRCPKCVRLIAVPETAAEPEPEVEPATDIEPAGEVEPAAEAEGAEAEDTATTEAIDQPDAEVEPEPQAAPEMAAEPSVPADLPPDRQLPAAVEPPVEAAAPAEQPATEPIFEVRARSAEPPLTAPEPADRKPQSSAPRRRAVPPPPAPPPTSSADQPVQTTLRIPPAPPARAGIPSIQRDETWEGTADFSVGQISVAVRPPTKPGLGVVASVVAGPSGTRVAAVTMNSDGTALISLGDPARAPVTVAWFVVPVVDGNA